LRGYLLDTDVISVFAPGRSDTPPTGGEVDRWFDRNEPQFFFSVVTIIELEVGVLTLARKSPGRRQRQLADWFDGFVERYEDKVLNVDLDIARIAGQISDRTKSVGSYPGLPDVVIAATAIAGELTLLSRNTRHFRALGIDSVDPFERLPP
jgi:predicted nucleic acid-binding protein